MKSLLQQLKENSQTMDLHFLAEHLIGTARTHNLTNKKISSEKAIQLIAKREITISFSEYSPNADKLYLKKYENNPPNFTVYCEIENYKFGQCILHFYSPKSISELDESFKGEIPILTHLGFKIHYGGYDPNKIVEID